VDSITSQICCARTCLRREASRHGLGRCRRACHDCNTQIMNDAPQPPAVTRQAIAAQDRSLPGKVTGRLKRAIDAMVWQAASRKEAAEMAKMTDHSLRQALKRPHVMAYYVAECEVLRVSGRAKRLHQLEALAEQTENRNAAVAAIKVAEQIGDDPTRSAIGRSAPGLTIVVLPAGAATPGSYRPAIDVSALPRVPAAEHESAVDAAAQEHPTEHARASELLIAPGSPPVRILREGERLAPADMAPCPRQPWE
jgi:hypothetical protein